MYAIKRIVLAFLFVTVAMAQTPEPPISDTRLTVHTLLREDLFAGFLADDMTRFTRGEKNLELLLEKRPSEKSSLLAWKGGAVMYRAVRAYEASRKDEFAQKYREALDLFAEARKIGPENDGIAAVVGGVYSLFADRLPNDLRPAAWSAAYDAYRQLWKKQAPFVERMPVHIKGELLGGLAQSAQRTGRTEELTQYLDKIITVLRGTPYEPVAKTWKENPKAAANSSITCLTCHDPGRLNARLASLNK